MAAAPQAPTALAYPTQGSADPYSASFYATQAALQFSEESILAAEQRAQRQANNSYEYNRSINARQVPLALQRNQNNANSQGLAESGVLAKTQGQTQTNFAQKASRLSEARRSAVERAQQAENTAKGNYALETNKNVAAEQERQLREAQENPPLPIGGTPANPGGVRTVEGPPGPGGVVPYSEKTPGGSVRVGAGYPSATASYAKSTPGGSVAVRGATRAAREARERAAKKATVG